MMLNVAGYITLQWILLWPWASQQLSHFWISKEPDELCDRPNLISIEDMIKIQKKIIFKNSHVFLEIKLIEL